MVGEIEAARLALEPDAPDRPAGLRLAVSMQLVLPALKARPATLPKEALASFALQVSMAASARTCTRRQLQQPPTLLMGTT